MVVQSVISLELFVFPVFFPSVSRAAEIFAVVAWIVLGLRKHKLIQLLASCL